MEPVKKKLKFNCMYSNCSFETKYFNSLVRHEVTQHEILLDSKDSKVDEITNLESFTSESVNN